jgi:hypothetical protein
MAGHNGPRPAIAIAGKTCLARPRDEVRPPCAEGIKGRSMMSEPKGKIPLERRRNVYRNKTGDKFPGRKMDDPKRWWRWR